MINIALWKVFVKKFMQRGSQCFILINAVGKGMKKFANC